MKLKLGSIISEAAGKLGGQVIQGNNSKLSLRSKANFTRKPGYYTYRRSGSLSEASQVFRTLTAANLRTLQGYCNQCKIKRPNGILDTPTPYEFFIAYAYWQNVHGLAIGMTATWNATITLPSSFSIAFDSVAQSVTASFSPSPLPSNWLHIYVSNMRKSSQKPDFKKVSYITNLSSASTSPNVITSAYKNVKPFPLISGYYVDVVIKFWRYGDPFRPITQYYSFLIV